MKKALLIVLIFSTTLGYIVGQNVILDGYVYEKYNRGFLNEVKITILDKSENLIGETMSDMTGHFIYEVPAGKVYLLDFTKNVFTPKREKISTVGKLAGEKVFVKTELERQPGYLLEITLAEKRFNQDVSVDAVNGSRIEIYNNTLKQEELVIDSAKSPVFSITLKQGNEYTILIRKKRFYNKRLHANVNINGCYLCMDGFGTVNPGVVSNLTSAEDNKLGTLIANVELEPIDMNRNIVIQNIYYAYNSAAITEPSKKELDKVVNLLRTNPSLIVELGSHTDSRGSDDYNLKLSQQRAQSAVDYIVSTGVEAAKLKAKGYGENKLVNNCGNDMTCSEEQHLQNRRTELRIVGFTNDPFDGRSLMEIMHEEEMAQFIKSGESDKEYVATPEGQVEAIDKNDVRPDPENSDKSAPSVSTEKKTTIEPFDENIPMEKPAQSTDIEQVIKVEPIEESIKIVTNNAPVKDNTSKISINLKKIDDYTGYKIEIFQAPRPLDATDSDLKMIAAEISSDIFVDVIKTGETSYMVGYFQGWTETENYLQKVIGRYPKARIIEYFKGKRLGN